MWPVNNEILNEDPQREDEMKPTQYIEHVWYKPLWYHWQVTMNTRSNLIASCMHINIIMQVNVML